MKMVTYAKITGEAEQGGKGAIAPPMYALGGGLAPSKMTGSIFFGKNILSKQL